MNAFEPLITHSSPSSRAVVRVAPASEPPPGSVSPNAPSVSPAASRGSHSLLLLLGAEPVDRHRAQRDPGLQGDRHRRVDPGQLLQREAEREVVAAHAAVLLGERAARTGPSRPSCATISYGNSLALVEIADDRGDLLAGELLDGLAQRLVLLAQPEVHHQLSSSCGFDDGEQHCVQRDRSRRRVHAAR